MSNSAADGVPWTSTLDEVVAETAAGRLLPGVHRCLLRVETPRRPYEWTAAASTHPAGPMSGPRPLARTPTTVPGWTPRWPSESPASPR
jgi:hypothetical protein